MESSGQVNNYLIVNRVEILGQAGCSACGRGFTDNPMGEKTLVLSVGNLERVYFFCGSCGDNIMGRVEADDAKKRYVWDWAVPLRSAGQQGQAG
jgi:hypothetical protein